MRDRGKEHAEWDDYFGGALAFVGGIDSTSRMTQGELLTRATVWLAVGAYGVGAGTMLLARGRAGWWRRARWLWTIGCGCFLAHVTAAFWFYHHWSHAAAYLETARQTEVMVGIRWGGGLYLNYLFASLWTTEVVWWWVAPARMVGRSAWMVGAIHGFYLFMIFNGTIVFGHGLVQGWGALVFAGLAVAWSKKRRGERARPAV